MPQPLPEAQRGFVVSQLSRAYPGMDATPAPRPVLDGLSFALPDGSHTGILGPSGSGKTTLLRLLAGLDLPDAGQIAFDGQVISRPGWALAPHLRGVGMVFQTPALWPHMSVSENILFGLGSLPAAERKSRLEQVLEQCGITALARRYPEQLSGGEAHRTALARALAPQPPVLLLDEPLAHLDVQSKEGLLDLLAQTTASAWLRILVYVSHDRQEAARLCSQLWQLGQGRLVAGQSQPGGSTSLVEGAV